MPKVLAIAVSSQEDVCLYLCKYNTYTKRTQDINLNHTNYTIPIENNQSSVQLGESILK